MLRKRGSGRRQDEGADSGAETGGSEYSRVSTSSSELSLEDVEDPFLVSIHIIADPGESRALQQAIDSLLAWIHPDLQLFRVSERRIPRKPRKSGGQATASQPALAVILFLQEEYDEEPILQLHESFRRPPWRFHHTERVHGNFLPYMPGSQDFFTLAQGTPLWAIRPVHYGKEIIRFTIYCRNENFVDIMRMYELILKRRVCQKKADFCVFPVYSNVDIDIQFSLKRLPGGHVPSPTESAVLEFRVKDIGQLVPLLPNPCSPISEGRWQTEDLDGNKILLQVLVNFFEAACGLLEIEGSHLKAALPTNTKECVIRMCNMILYILIQNKPGIRRVLSRTGFASHPKNFLLHHCQVPFPIAADRFLTKPVIPQDQLIQPHFTLPVSAFVFPTKT
ncbi:protein FAM124A isoform X2 [Hemicordylus capensis]|uniref:protein FAM124A isoform X2 n=1 Tax=Hemicordylus capensis TaxID=884348 RepID=UPI002303B095|nr:protein FAM124A isoform X2 [Hemicordylus capensis]